MITIVGLGCDPGDLTAAASAALRSGAKVILRTRETPVSAAAFASVAASGVPPETLDGVYGRCRSFDALNRKLAACVLDAAKEGDVVYCVDGSVTEDVSAQILLRRDRTARVADGVSKSSAAFAAARVSCRDRCALSAYGIREGARPFLPLCVYDVDCAFVAGDVKLRLCDLFGDEAPVFFVRGGRAKKMKAYEIDRLPAYDATCAVVMGEIPFLQKERFDYDDLVALLRLLRAPGGCPWDRAQTHESIRRNMLEEAYELVDAIGLKDDGKICEETGDVLMQGAFHSVLAEERGAFTPEDVTSEVCRKLIFRHSHIFGKDRAESEAGALSVWEKNKAAEKGQTTGAQRLRDVPSAFPAAMRAQKAQKRAADYGYDFRDAAEAAEKVGEELAELLDALRGGDAAHIAEEAGDLLFSAVNVGRLAGADCEESLRAGTDKFIARFCATEALIAADGKQMRGLPADELWAYYERAKAAEVSAAEKLSGRGNAGEATPSSAAPQAASEDGSSPKKD